MECLIWNARHLCSENPPVNLFVGFLLTDVWQKLGPQLGRIGICLGGRCMRRFIMTVLTPKPPPTPTTHGTGRF